MEEQFRKIITAESSIASWYMLKRYMYKQRLIELVKDENLIVTHSTYFFLKFVIINNEATEA
jgi:hypothetical protein